MPICRRVRDMFAVDARTTAYSTIHRSLSGTDRPCRAFCQRADALSHRSDASPLFNDALELDLEPSAHVLAPSVRRSRRAALRPRSFTKVSEDAANSCVRNDGNRLTSRAAPWSLPHHQLHQHIESPRLCWALACWRRKPCRARLARQGLGSSQPWRRFEVVDRLPAAAGMTLIWRN